MTQDPRVDAYIERAAPFAQPLLAHWRQAVHAACPGTEETIKWGMPFFQHGGRTLAHMAAFKQHCAFGIYAGEKADDERSAGAAMGNFGRVQSLADLPPPRELARLLKSGIAAIDRGDRPTRPRPSEARPPAEEPEDLRAALDADAAARSGFDALAPGARREYIEWICEAKRAETRSKRLATTVEQAAEGKSLHWRYQARR